MMEEMFNMEDIEQTDDLDIKKGIFKILQLYEDQHFESETFSGLSLNLARANLNADPDELVEEAKEGFNHHLKTQHSYRVLS